MLVNTRTKNLFKNGINNSLENIPLVNVNKNFDGIVILKTNIKTLFDFGKIKKRLEENLKIIEMTIDLDDRDKVVRVIGDNVNAGDVISCVNDFGFLCEELSD